MDGQVVFVTRYHKSQSQWDKPKVVPLFLPWRVGQLVAVYMAYLQPFREYLAVQVLGGGGWSDYVLGGPAGAVGDGEADAGANERDREEDGKLIDNARLPACGHGIGEIEEAEVEEGESPIELQNNRTTEQWESA
ncbi:hypothetical protein LTR28_005319 [Elasticomyces elasticus]|nr:hypothetical protein LTR28_005319 [Elasticomyces elasticus]